MLGALLLSFAFWEQLPGRTDFHLNLSVSVKARHVLTKCVQRCSQLAWLLRSPLPRCGGSPRLLENGMQMGIGERASGAFGKYSSILGKVLGWGEDFMKQQLHSTGKLEVKSCGEMQGEEQLLESKACAWERAARLTLSCTDWATLRKQCLGHQQSWNRAGFFLGLESEPVCALSCSWILFFLLRSQLETGICYATKFPRQLFVGKVIRLSYLKLMHWKLS